MECCIIRSRSRCGFFYFKSYNLVTIHIRIIYSLGINQYLYRNIYTSTVCKPIFHLIDNNRTKSCLPNLNSTECIFQHQYGYNALVLNNTDPIQRDIIKFLVDNKHYLRESNLFAFIWFSAFLFPLE